MKLQHIITILSFFAVCSTSLKAQFAPEQFIHTDTLADQSAPWFLIDWDSDGDRDILFAANVPNTSGIFEHSLLWLENDGTGHFGTPKVFQDIGFGEYWIGDLNVDGSPDLIFRPGGLGLQWRANLSGLPGNVVPIAPDGTSSIINLRDFDGDGDLDVVEHGRWFENGGFGFFIETHTIDAGVPDLFVPDFQTGDLNGDGRQDFLFSALDQTLDITWLLLRRQLPNGLFAAPDTLDQQPNGYHAFGPQPVDLDSDGDLDVIAHYFDPAGPYQTRWYANDGTGHFGPGLVLDIYWSEVSPLSSLLTDFDGDGLIDLLTSALDTLSGNQKLAWLRNLGGGQFELEITNLNGTGDYLKIFDLTGDGQNDIISNNQAFLLTPGIGNGQFLDARSLHLHAAGASLTRAADPDNDGDLDIIFFSSLTANIGWWPNDGAGHFGQPQILQRVHDGYGNLLDCRDLDGDAVPDLFLHTDSRAFVWHGTGGGQFASEADTFPMYDPLFYEPVLADADGDGDLDVLSSNVDSGIWFPNNGFGVFGLPQTGSPTVFDGLNDCLGDLDGDGDVDLLLRRFDFYNGLYLRQGIFWKPQTSPGIYGPDELVVHFPAPTYSWGGMPACARDIDGDGDLDVTTGTNWYKNDGTGHGWVAQGLYGDAGPGHYPTWNYLDLDFDEDSDIDNFNVFNYTQVPGNLLTLNTNDGDGHFWEQPWYRYLPENLGSIRIAAHDFDRDGDPDVLLYRNGTVAWIENLSGEPPVQARCFLDGNANGLRDSAETLLPGVALRLDPGGLVAFSDELGLARFHVDTGAYVLSYLPDDCRMLSTDTATFMVTVPEPGAPRWFGFLPDSSKNSIAVSMASAPTRCGFVVPFWATLRNTGCISAPATFALRLDGLTTLVAAAWPPDFQQGDSLVWRSPNPLAPGEMASFWFQLQMPGAEHLGETLRLKLYSWPSDAPSLVRRTTFSSVINCSYDPNDKMVNLQAVPPGYDPLTSELIYTVRFQNTGTDTAFTVIVRDTLDTQLDWASFKPLGASHPTSVLLDLDNGIVVYKFESIHLPDSNINEVESHGFFQFTIRMKPDLPEGSVLENLASIYFDFNPAVLTNTVKTSINQVLSTSSKPGSSYSTLLSPNPNSGIFSVELPLPATQGMTFRIAGLTGQVLQEQPIQAGANIQTVQTKDLPAGLYFLQVVLEGRILAVEKFVKQ